MWLCPPFNPVTLESLDFPFKYLYSPISPLNVLLWTSRPSASIPIPSPRTHISQHLQLHVISSEEVHWYLQQKSTFFLLFCFSKVDFQNSKKNFHFSYHFFRLSSQFVRPPVKFKDPLSIVRFQCLRAEVWHVNLVEFYVFVQATTAVIKSTWPPMEPITQALKWYPRLEPLTSEQTFETTELRQSHLIPPVTHMNMKPPGPLLKTNLLFRWNN